MTHSTHGKVNSYAQQQKKAPKTSSGSRETDARALLACARRLDEAKQAMLNGSKDLMAYGDAIRHNLRLWTIFQVSLCDPENPLPQDLKVTLLNLSRYVDKTSLLAVGKFSPELVDSLININRIIAEGLNKTPPTDAYIPPPDTREIPNELITSA